MKVGELVIDTILRSAGVKKGLHDMRSEMDKTQKSAKSMKANFETLTTGLAKFGLAMNGLTILYRGLSNSINGLTHAADIQEAAEARLVAGLKNVRTAGEGAAEMLKEYARQMQQVTAFGDEQVISASAMLSTFQLNEHQIKAIIPRLLDMAASQEKATGSSVDLEQIAIALGKAFTGQPGLLARYGVVLDKTAIKTQGFSGILKSLDDNFKGIAEATAKTRAGQMRQYANQVGDLKEQFGALLREGLMPVMKFMSAVVKLIANSPPAIKKMILALGGLTSAFILLNISGMMPLVLSAIPKLIAAFTGLATAILPMLGPAGLILSLVAGLGILLLSHKSAQAAAEEHAKAEKQLADITSQVATETVNLSKKQIEALREQAKLEKERIQNLLEHKKAVEGKKVEAIIAASPAYGAITHMPETNIPGFGNLDQAEKKLSELNTKIDAYTQRIQFLQNIPQMPSQTQTNVTIPQAEIGIQGVEVAGGTRAPAAEGFVRAMPFDQEKFDREKKYWLDNVDEFLKNVKAKQYSWQLSWRSNLTEMFNLFSNELASGEMKWDRFLSNLKSMLIQKGLTIAFTKLLNAIFPETAIGGNLLSIATGGGGALGKVSSDITRLQKSITDMASRQARPVIVLQGTLPGQEFVQQTVEPGLRNSKGKSF